MTVSSLEKGGLGGSVFLQKQIITVIIISIPPINPKTIPVITPPDNLLEDSLELFMEGLSSLFDPSSEVS